MIVGSQIKDGVIVNDHVSASAAIAGSKLDMALAELNNVTITSPATGQPIVYGGSVYENLTSLLLTGGDIEKTTDSALTFTSGQTDASDAEAFVFDTQALSTEGAKALVIKNDGTETFNVDKDGDITTQGLIIQEASTGTNEFNADINFNYKQHINAIMQRVNLLPPFGESNRGLHVFSEQHREAFTVSGPDIVQMGSTLEEDQMTSSKDAVVRGLYNGVKNIATHEFEANLGEKNPYGYLRFREKDYYLYSTGARTGGNAISFNTAVKSPENLRALTYINGLSKQMYRNLLAADNADGTENGRFWSKKEHESDFELNTTLDEPNYPTIWDRFSYLNSSEKVVILNKHASHPKLMVGGDTDIEPLIDNFNDNSIGSMWEDQEQKNWSLEGYGPVKYFYVSWTYDHTGGAQDRLVTATGVFIDARVGDVFQVAPGNPVGGYYIASIIDDDNATLAGNGLGGDDNGFACSYYGLPVGEYVNNNTLGYLRERNNKLEFKTIINKVPARCLRTVQEFENVGDATSYLEMNCQMLTRKRLSGSIYMGVCWYWDDDNWVLFQFRNINQEVVIEMMKNEFGVFSDEYALNNNYWIANDVPALYNMNHLKKIRLDIHNNATTGNLDIRGRAQTAGSPHNIILWQNNHNSDVAWDYVDSTRTFTAISRFGSAIVGDMLCTDDNIVSGVIETVNDADSVVLETAIGGDESGTNFNWGSPYSFDGDTSGKPTGFFYVAGDQSPSCYIIDNVTATDGTDTVSDSFSGSEIDTVKWRNDSIEDTICGVNREIGSGNGGFDNETKQTIAYANYTDLEVKNNQLEINLEGIEFSNDSLDTFSYVSGTGVITFTSGTPDLSGISLYPISYFIDSKGFRYQVLSFDNTAKTITIATGQTNFNSTSPTIKYHGMVTRPKGFHVNAPGSEYPGFYDNGKMLRHKTPLDKTQEMTVRGKFIFSNMTNVRYGPAVTIVWDNQGKYRLFVVAKKDLSISDKVVLDLYKSYDAAYPSIVTSSVNLFGIQEGKEYELKMTYNPTSKEVNVYWDSALKQTGTLANDPGSDGGQGNPLHGPAFYVFANDWWSDFQVDCTEYSATPYVTQPTLTLKNFTGFAFSNRDKSELTLTDGGAGNAWVDYDTAVDLSNVNIGDQIFDSSLDNYSILEIDQTRGSGKGGVRIATSSGFDDSAVSLTDHGCIIIENSIQHKLMDGTYTGITKDTYADKMYLLVEDGTDTRLLTIDLNDSDAQIANNEVIKASSTAGKDVSIEGGYAFVLVGTEVFRYDIKNDNNELFANSFTTATKIKYFDGKVHVYDENDKTLYIYEMNSSSALWNYPCGADTTNVKQLHVDRQSIKIVSTSSTSKIVQILNRGH